MGKTLPLPLILYFSLILSSLLAIDSSSQQPLNPGDLPQFPPENTVPALPVQSQPHTCHLDLSAELFGGVKEACASSPSLDRSRCCPVLAAWLYAAHARSALVSHGPLDSNLPAMPDDSQKCVDTLQTSLIKRDIRIPQPNETCDAVLCFCGIRLHQMSSLSCPKAFNLTSLGSGFRNATPTAAVKDLETSCRNSSYDGCTNCLKALDKVKGSDSGPKEGGERAKRMFNRDCQLMGLTWLLARNKTTYIPTVSAVLRAIMYSAHPPHQSTCSPDQENMPLAVNSLQFQMSEASSASKQIASMPLPLLLLMVPLILFSSLISLPPLSVT
ncbi:hypothetical protein AMTRI_Chr02g260950 [Amborella trichopoda]|uniref:SPARK domain-containing protein n=1 Tax=Amborella trichopoda TaxID=13333 RepID=W1P127_AMBTC|nr:uncharacterized GPI-anchored protein At4g28100 [Amborella trichopoda]ERN03542.1 hypothetical protein AMTR_s00003p00271650 [Amborella trichopoda]|eukprot:XP_006841867.1 uncharacterized GPI-anchored protein At4g28100 [Amborella trichopoda]